MNLQPAEWIEKYGDYLFSIAFMKLRNKEIAEDIVQDTFLSAFKALSNFKGNSSEKTWLAAILKNKIIDYYRKKDVLKDVTVYLSQTEHAFHDFFFENNHDRYGHWLKNKTPEPWEPAFDPDSQDQDLENVLQACMHKLPQKILLVFTARYLDEENAETICKELQLSPSNYWVILHRAKVIMRECLAKNWFNES